MGKFSYLARSIQRFADPSRFACPNCGATGSALVERKAVITALRRCNVCLLMFRTPADEPTEAVSFYNSDYVQGFTTDLPQPDELARLKASNWEGEKDYTYYIGVLRSLGLQPGARLFDFGCSWGYGSHQLASAGFDVLSYEISVPRGRYGSEHLGVRLVDDFDAWVDANPGSMDAFFSAHVLEHVPSPSKVISKARRLLKPGGLFVSFFPNGSAACRAVHPAWSQLWGEVHPNFLDDVFLNAAIADRPRMYGASPMSPTPEQARWLGEAPSPGALYLNEMRGDEMLVTFRA